MLQVSGLRASYGRIPILTGVSFGVEKSEFVGILGHNGMGKTTLMKALMGYLPATAGQVSLDGVDITRDAPAMRAMRGLGYVPQGRDIFPALSVQENLRMGCLLAKTDERSTIERILSTFPRLTGLLERPGGALSGGEQQLLALARCLCGGPRLILLDEPTEGIQPSIVEEIVETLQALRAEHSMTMILVEQDLQFIASLADRVLIIQKGAITREVMPQEITDPDLVSEFVGMGSEPA
jgi:branched-chain amino acid transport system ATP-binding protein